MERVGIDIGGTFTDLVGLRDGHILIDKTSTTPDDPTRGVADSFTGWATQLSALSEILHGSTTALTLTHNWPCLRPTRYSTLWST